MKNKFFILLGFLLAASTLGFSQSAKKTSLKEAETELKQLDYDSLNAGTEEERRNATYSFIKTLVQALKEPNSYNYAFDSLKNISILRSPNNNFRIFSWLFSQDDGTFRYYGAIQMNNKERLELYPLKDHTNLIKDLRDTVTDNNHWVGAQYYDIIAPASPGDPYLLLGWKGIDFKSSMRLIEPLRIENGKVTMGEAVLMNENGKPQNRMLFEYTRQASMMLRYIPKKHWIVFDHLIPMGNGGNPDDRANYAPDLSYDGLKYQRGLWTYMSKLDLENDPDLTEGIFNDPKKLAGENTMPVDKVNEGGKKR